MSKCCLEVCLVSDHEIIRTVTCRADVCVKSREAWGVKGCDIYEKDCELYLKTTCLPVLHLQHGLLLSRTKFCQVVAFHNNVTIIKSARYALSGKINLSNVLPFAGKINIVCLVLITLVYTLPTPSIANIWTWI